MFTGLIEEVGEVTRIETLRQGSRLTLRAERVSEALGEGDSIAVDGVCLTARHIDRHGFCADVSPETIARTNMSFYGIGTPVNLERPLAVGQRLGGHFVQGHVDSICRVLDQKDEGEFVRMTFSLPASLRPFLVEKGSVALNGVSLTVASLEAGRFDVQLIPHTLACTNLSHARRAEVLNVEVDILGKYVAQLLAARLDEAPVAASGRADAPEMTLGLGDLIRLPGD